MALNYEILFEIEAFLQRTDMTPSRFGKAAVNDEKFVFRLRQGGGITAKTIDRVREFIREQDAVRKLPTYVPPSVVTPPAP